MRYTHTMSEQPNELLGFIPEGAGEFDEPAETTAIAPGEKKKYIRKENWSIDRLTDEKKLITWINSTQSVPLDAVDAHIVAKSYPAIIWLYRKCAIEGDLKRTKALDMWLKWAGPIVNRPPLPAEAKPSVGSAAFGLREPAKDKTDEKDYNT